MKILFDLADRWMDESDWKDLALMKFCLCAMGILLGIQIPEKKKKDATLVSGLVFLTTYVALMAKVARILYQMVAETEVKAAATGVDAEVDAEVSEDTEVSEEAEEEYDLAAEFRDEE